MPPKISLSPLTGQPPWPAERGRDPAVIYSPRAREILARIRTCEDKVSAALAAAEGAELESDDYCYAVLAVALLEGQFVKEVTYQRFLDAARHHAGVGETSVRVPTQKEIRHPSAPSIQLHFEPGCGLGYHWGHPWSERRLDHRSSGTGI